MKSLLEVYQNALKGAAMLGTATSSGLGIGTPQQPSPAGGMEGNNVMMGVHEAAAQPMGGCGRGKPERSQQTGAGLELDRPSAVGLPLEQPSPAGSSDVVSTMSSVPALHAKEGSSGDEDDEEVSIGSYGRRGSLAAGASMQHRAAIATSAVEAVVAPGSGDSRDIVIDIEDSEGKVAREGSPAPAGRASSAQASNAAQARNYPPKEQRSTQVRTAPQM